jgi:type IV pilus assembly protein PilA
LREATVTRITNPIDPTTSIASVTLLVTRPFSRRAHGAGRPVARGVQRAAAVRRAKSTHRAFTLVELMIVVAMIGIIAALGIVGYRKYIHTAQSSEAKSVIQMIRGGQEAYKSEMLQYLNASATISTYYPNANPTNDARFSWVNPAHSDYAQWKLLAVNPDGPVRFGYACIAGVAPAQQMQALEFSPSVTLPTLPAGTVWYEIQAKNDHDNNGKYALFASTSLSGEIMSQNEQE